MPISFSSLGGGGGGKFQKTELITATQSWTVPADVDQIEVWVFGGGGGGGGYSNVVSTYQNAGGGGGGGGCEYKILNVTPGSSHTITIGAGGAGQGSANDMQAKAANGAKSVFGSNLAIGYGGTGGNPGTTSSFQYAAVGGFTPDVTSSTFSDDYAGSGGGGGSFYTDTGVMAGGGGGGAGGAAANTGNYSTNNNSGSVNQVSHGQGYAGAHGTPSNVGFYGIGYAWRGTGGKGIMGFGGGGGGALVAGDWFSFNWTHVYNSLRYRGRGVDGGGDGSLSLYNGAPGAGSVRTATNGAANRAGGGGAGSRTNWTLHSGGNGGSGVVVIKYWTAG